MFLVPLAVIITFGLEKSRKISCPTPARILNPLKTFSLRLLFLLSSTICTWAADDTGPGNLYYVDVNRGSDSNPGTAEAPFQSVAKALLKVGAGDAIKLVKADQPIPLMINIRNKSGEPGKPIILDGQGNTLTGAVPIDPADWVQEQPGLFSNDHLYKFLKPGDKGSSGALIQRVYFLFDGQQNRMGRSSKGKQTHLPPASSLSDGQWTYEESSAKFYLKIDPAKTLADYKIEVPLREDGIAVRDTCENLIIRNFDVTHVWNDGFNLHGQTRHIVFENITATECGDDGISEHEGCEMTIHGFTARRNSTGMCDGDDCISTADHVVLEDNYAFNVLQRNGTHIFMDSSISAAAPEGGYGGICLNNVSTPSSTGPSTVKFVRCHIPFPTGANPNGRPPFYAHAAVALDLTDCTLDGPVIRSETMGEAK